MSRESRRRVVGVRSDDLVAALPGLLRYARSMTDDAALAEDLVQTTMVRALEKGHTFRGESSTATWLHRILHSCFVDHVRRSRELPEEDIWARVERQWSDPRFSLDLAEVTVLAQTVGELRDSLLRLPTGYRSAVVLHDMEGLTVPEVARIQQVSLAAAKQRVRRGRMMLVSALASAAARRHAMAGVPLDCWDARQQVSDYLDGELSPRAARLLERHLELCPTCPPLYSALVVSNRAVSDLRDTDDVIPEHLATRIAELVGSGSSGD